MSPGLEHVGVVNVVRVKALQEEAELVTWDQPPSVLDASGFHQGWQGHRIIHPTHQRETCPEAKALAADMAEEYGLEVRFAWLGKLGRGGWIEEHTDAHDGLVRYHVPLLCGPLAVSTFITDGRRHLMQVGKVYRVDHHRPHSVPPHDYHRVHLCVDGREISG